MSPSTTNTTNAITTDINTQQKQQAMLTEKNENSDIVEDEQLLVVDAEKETSFQVELLINYIIKLQHQVQQLSSCNTFYQTCVQKCLALP